MSEKLLVVGGHDSYSEMLCLTAHSCQIGPSHATVPTFAQMDVHTLGEYKVVVVILSEGDWSSFSGVSAKTESLLSAESAVKCVLITSSDDSILQLMRQLCTANNRLKILGQHDVQEEIFQLLGEVLIPRGAESLLLQRLQAH